MTLFSHHNNIGVVILSYLYKAKTKIKGYHGTYPAYIESIKQNNFQQSVNDKWLGDAVYFFIEGVNDIPPQETAKQYSIDSSWNKILKKYMHEEYVVLEAEIKVIEENYLDLTISDGARLFNSYRQHYLEKLYSSGARVNKKPTDVDMLDLMREQLGIEFVKANVYIKFGIQRRQFLDSRIPNVTIFAVNNPAKNILKPSIKEVLTGQIS